MKLPMKLAVLALLPTTSALADWSSGGGFVLKDAHNPWFVQNTTVVSYCIQKDADHFSVADEKVDSIINKALTYWKAEFARSNQGAHGLPYNIQVATQTFTKTTCDGHQPLVFQFGWLSDEQKQKISDPKQLVGLAARVSYDVPKLQGAGFIYIAADSGPLKPDMLADGRMPLADGFWSEFDGIPLLRAVTHELGHVFGVPHRGNEFALMGEQHLELLAGGFIGRTGETVENYELPWLFNDDYVTDYRYCNHNLSSLYRTPAGMNCLHIKGDLHTGLTWTVSIDETSQQFSFAKVSYEMFSSANYEDLVTLYVPPNHPMLGPHLGYLRVVSLQTSYDISGKLTYADPSRIGKPVQTRLGGDGFAILGEKFDTIQTIIGGRYLGKDSAWWP